MWLWGKTLVLQHAVCAFPSWSARTRRQNSYSFLAPQWNLIVFSLSESFSVWRELLILSYHKIGNTGEWVNWLMPHEASDHQVYFQGRPASWHHHSCYEYGEMSFMIVRRDCTMNSVCANNSRHLLLYNSSFFYPFFQQSVIQMQNKLS